MNQSPELDKLATALAAAQATMTGAVKGSLNPHFKNRYADLESVIDAVRGPFAANGLSFTQTGSLVGAELCLRTTLLHASGQWIAGDYALRPAKQDPQGYGAAMTYARRYCLAAIAGLPQVDDDGETASGRGDTPARLGQKRQNEAPGTPASGDATAAAPVVPHQHNRADLDRELEAAFGVGEIRAWFLAYCRAKNYLREGQDLRDLEPMNAVRALSNKTKLEAQFTKEKAA